MLVCGLTDYILTITMKETFDFKMGLNCIDSMTQTIWSHVSTIISHAFNGILILLSQITIPNKNKFKSISKDLSIYSYHQ